MDKFVTFSEPLIYSMSLGSLGRLCCNLWNALHSKSAVYVVGSYEIYVHIFVYIVRGSLPSGYSYQGNIVIKFEARTTQFCYSPGSHDQLSVISV